MFRTGTVKTMPSPLQKASHFLRHSTLVRKNPKVLPKIIAGYAKTLILGKTVLRTVEFTVTANCNVNCEMCYASRIKRVNTPTITPNQYHKLWQQAKKLGAFSSIISGGEPTTRNDLFSIIQAIEPDKNIIALVTNSTLLDKQFLFNLKKSGVNILHLSLNSISPKENDHMRDFQGHFKKVQNISTTATDLGFEVCLSTIVCHNALHRAKEVAFFAKANKLGVVFSLACPTGNWAGKTGHLLTPNEWRDIDRFMTRNPHIRSDWTINFSVKKECPGGREKLCISPYGDVMGCGMNLISHGNVFDEPLEEIWQRMQQWPPFAKRSERCLIALDQDYLNNYLLPISDHHSLPVALANHPISSSK